MILVSLYGNHDGASDKPVMVIPTVNFDASVFGSLSLPLATALVVSAPPIHRLSGSTSPFHAAAAVELAASHRTPPSPRRSRAGTDSRDIGTHLH